MENHKNNKSRLEKEIDNEIESYVDSMVFNSNPNKPVFQSREMKRESMKHQIREELKMPEFTQLIGSALEILNLEGDQSLREDLKASTEKLKDISIKDLMKTNIQILTNIKDESIKAIFDIAQSKFNEGNYLQCLALFSLLSLLNSGQPEFWFRLGLAAQKCDKFELATRAYAAAIQIDPNIIGARLFAAECFLYLKLFNEAKAELEEAKKISKNYKFDKIWLDLLSTLEHSLKA